MTPRTPRTPDNLSYNDPNYVINQTFNPGTLTITPAPLTITAGDQSEVYGSDTPYAGPSTTLDAAMNLSEDGGLHRDSPGSSSPAIRSPR